MRTARRKMVGRGCIYHCMNRLAAVKNDYPLTDVDKEYGFKLLLELCDFFLIEPISACWLGNHFHLVLFAPGDAPDLETAAKRHNAYYDAAKMELNPAYNPEKCRDMAEQMIDLSRFMSLYQQRYTCYYNRRHNRRGTLWADRFKSTILEGSREALWNCVKYVELNPVRAGLVADPANYRFCTWGRHCGSGRHPFHANFCKHMRGVAELHSGQSLSDDDVIAEFRGELARIRAWEADQDGELDEDGRTRAEVAAVKARTKGDSMPVRFLRRTRYWSDGAIIGSKAFVQEIGCMFEHEDNHVRILEKRLSRGVTPEGGMLHCFKQLRTHLDQA